MKSLFLDSLFNFHLSKLKMIIKDPSHLFKRDNLQNQYDILLSPMSIPNRFVWLQPGTRISSLLERDDPSLHFVPGTPKQKALCCVHTERDTLLKSETPVFRGASDLLLNACPKTRS